MKKVDKARLSNASVNIAMDKDIFQRWLSVAILCFINLINYMDRFVFLLKRYHFRPPNFGIFQVHCIR